MADECEGSIRRRSIRSRCVPKALRWEPQRTGRSITWVRPPSSLSLPPLSTSSSSPSSHHTAHPPPFQPPLTPAPVVEITPIGIKSLQWKFYIIWTLFNFSFIPIVYLFYPETADRTLEDLDRYFRDNHNVIVCGNKEAISSKRPEEWVEHEREEVRRNSSVVGGEGVGGLGGQGVMEKGVGYGESEKEERLEDV